MEIVIFITLFFFASFKGLSQSEASDNQNKITCYIKSNARPKGGFEEFKEKLNLRDALRNKIQRPLTLKFILVKIRFVVEKDGSLTNMTVLDDKLNIASDFFEIIKEKSVWEPAVFNEKVIRSNFTLPIKIALD